MDKITEALSKLLPQEQVRDIASAVKEMMHESKKELESEYNTKLKKAYEKLSEEVKAAEKTGYEGYQEAWSIISDLRNRLETQRTEHEKALEEGYEEAYQMLQAERGKVETQEAELLEMYDNRLAEMKAYFVDKVHNFLLHKGKEIYESARREVVNDPRMVEHKLAFDKVVECVSDYISDEDYTVATNSKLTESRKEIEDLKARVRLLESKNVALGREKDRLTEAVREKEKVITESVEVNKKERAQKAKDVTGRGWSANEKVVRENVQPAATKTEEEDLTNESSSNDLQLLREARVLAGIVKPK